MLAQTIITSMIGLATIITTAYLLRANKRKIQAEETAIITSTALTLIAPLRTELAAQALEIEELRGELEEQKARRYALREELEAEIVLRTQLEARVHALENWIRLNTSIDPEVIT